MKQEAIELADKITLRRRHRQILLTLADARTFLTTDQIADRIYSDDPDGGPLDARGCVMTHIHWLRKKIAPYGMSIIASRHLGYRLEMPARREEHHG